MTASRRRVSSYAASSLAFLFAAVGVARAFPDESTPVQTVGTTVSGARTTPAGSEVIEQGVKLYEQHVQTLSNPYFEGRCPGTRGNRLAAEYAEFHFKGMGLEPAFEAPASDAKLVGDSIALGAPGEKTYFQHFESRYGLKPGQNVKVNAAEVSYTLAGVEVGIPVAITLERGKDFNPLGYAANGEASGPLVFVGYSIDRDDKNYKSEPAKDSLKGKIALVYRFEPMNEQGKSKWADERWSFSAALEPKLRAIANAGASAIILANPPGAADDRAAQLPGLELEGRRALKIPVVAISNEKLDALVRNADAQGRSAMDLRKFADNLEGGGEPIELSKGEVRIKLDIERTPTITQNVGAVLKGSGALADEWVVIGAHYDHLGYGYFGSRDRNPEGKLHCGADDNASGTSGVLMVAKWLSESAKAMPADQPRRSILFLLFSAEESGLEGSKFYCEHPIAPIEKHAFMINMDMIGRVREGKCDIESASSARGLQDWLKPYLDASGMNYNPKRGSSGRSDHASFDAKKVPVIFFFTGLHDEYHTPEDIAETINFEGGVRVSELASRVLLDAATRPERFEHRRAATNSGDEKPAADEQAEQTPAPRGRVRFGIAPGDYSGDTPGVLVGDVFDNTPAAKAGLKKGDLMTKWNGKELADVETWMPLLQQAKAGDVVKVTFKRDGAEQTVDVTLAARGAPQQ